MTRITESEVEAAALEWLAVLGYAVLHGPDIGPEGPASERGSHDEVLLTGRLREALVRLNPNLPDALDEEGKPVGWLTYTLGELAQHHCATLSPGAQPERIYEHYSIPAYDAGNEPTIELGGSIKSNKTIVPKGAVLLSKLNPKIERVWLPNLNGKVPPIASTEFLALTPLAPATRSVLYCLFRSSSFRAEMGARVTGTSKSYQRVPPRSLLTCEVLVANPKLLASFDRTVSTMMYRLLSNRRESRELAQTRDLLLPKLVSGEIRLRDVERAVKAVA